MSSYKNLRRKQHSHFFKRNKKAFGDAVSSLILFIAVISVSTGVVILFKNFVSQTQDSFSVQSDAVNNKLKSVISISNIYYDTSTNTTYVYVKNTGEIKLVPKNFDFYLDNAFVSGFSSKEASNLSSNMSLLVPQDTVALVYPKSLSTGTHEVRIVTQYGSTDQDLFNN